jgi:hypothetical protein
MNDLTISPDQRAPTIPPFINQFASIFTVIDNTERILQIQRVFEKRVPPTVDIQNFNTSKAPRMSQTFPQAVLAEKFIFISGTPASTRSPRPGPKPRANPSFEAVH